MKFSGFDERSFLYNIKFLAIICVISAHSATVVTEETMLNMIASKFLACIGTIGVPIFFIVSGYLYYKDNRNFKLFVSDKFSKIIIPWLFCETIVWLYVVLRKGGTTLGSWLSFLVGINHSTYFLSVLIVLFLIYFKLKNSLIFTYTTILLALISFYLTSNGTNVLDNYLKTPYLNPFFWMLYFSSGILLSKFHLLKKFAIFCNRIFFVNLVFFLIILFLHIYSNSVFSYWSKWAILNSTVSIILIFGLSVKITNSKIRVFEDIGKQSFSIYLLHELVVGFIVLFTSINSSWILVLVRPILILIIVYLLIRFYKFITRRLKNKLVWYSLIGAK